MQQNTVRDYESAREIRVSLSFLDKIRFLLMGKKKPDYFTRIIYYLGLTFGWFYFFIWFLTSYFSVILTNMLEPEAVSVWKARFNAIASFVSDDPLKTFQWYSLLQIAIFGGIFLGLCFFWRKWKIGLLMFLLGHVMVLGSTLFIMGKEYIFDHISFTDKIIYGIGTVPFIIYMIFKKRPKKVEEEVE